MASVQCMLKNVRLSYAYIWDPKEDTNGVPKYTCSLIISKDDVAMIEEIKNKMKECIAQNSKLCMKNGKLIPNFKLPLRDGDTERDGDDAYQNSMFINGKANADRPLLIVDGRRNPILDRNQVYSGCYANVFVSFYPYDKNGNRGIGVGLNGIQKVRDGESLGGATVSANVFEDLGGDDTSDVADLGDII